MQGRPSPPRAMEGRSEALGGRRQALALWMDSRIVGLHAIVFAGGASAGLVGYDPLRARSRDRMRPTYGLGWDHTICKHGVGRMHKAYKNTRPWGKHRPPLPRSFKPPGHEIRACGPRYGLLMAYRGSNPLNRENRARGHSGALRGFPCPPIEPFLSDYSGCIMQDSETRR